MKKKDNLRLVLILAVFFLALFGWRLHLLAHPVAEDLEHYIPFISGLISVVVVPVLFIFRSTIPFAYLINGMTVIIGTIVMTHFSIKNPPPAWSLQTIFLGTLLADIILLWAKFAVGKALFDLESTIKNPDGSIRHGRFFRFPNMGFWFVHVFTLTVVYMLSLYLW